MNAREKVVVIMDSIDTIIRRNYHASISRDEEHVGEGTCPFFPWFSRAGAELHHESKRLQIFEVWVQLFPAAAPLARFYVAITYDAASRVACARRLKAWKAGPGATRADFGKIVSQGIRS